MDEMLHLTCPDCGADMNLSADGMTAKCEYCGHSAVIRKKETKTETQKMIENLRKERAAHPAPESSYPSPDELRGGILAALSAFFLRSRFRLSQVARYAVFLVCALFSFVLLRTYVPAEFINYLPIAGMALLLAGIFCVKISYNNFRSVPLALGVGSILAWLMRLFEMTR